MKQRVRKRQPDGTWVGDGTSPVRMIRVSAAPSEWEVMRIYDDREGISHVALRQVDDPTSWKTVATELLLIGIGYAIVSDI